MNNTKIKDMKVFKTLTKQILLQLFIDKSFE